jgi:putative hydrolase of the HAD superfamily
MKTLITKYSWIIFDADNTLFDYDKAESIALMKTLDEHNICYEKKTIISTYHKINHKLWKQLETGKITTQQEIKTQRTQQLFDKIGARADINSFAERYLVNLSENGHLIDHALNTVQTLAKSHKLVLMTNGMTKVQRPRFNFSPITKYFNHIIISEEIRHSKPSKQIFDYAFKKMDHPNKHEVIIIGDSLGSDIQGGINYGIDSMWYNPKKVNTTHNATYELNNLLDLIF